MAYMPEAIADDEEWTAPCPGCSKPARFWQSDRPEHGFHSLYRFIECQSCGLMDGDWHPGEPEHEFEPGGELTSDEDYVGWAD
ncbi:MAG: hypothetical protein JO212_02095 [Acetobacteraceae bacterium]|nr:hypothetical protein [Acetobacteraceae bacterium]